MTTWTVLLHLPTLLRDLRRAISMSGFGPAVLQRQLSADLTDPLSWGDSLLSCSCLSDVTTLTFSIQGRIKNLYDLHPPS